MNKKIKTKKYMALLLLIMTLVATAACSEESTGNEKSKTKAAKAEIKIDVMRHESFLLGAIMKFNETHKNISINYGDVINYSEEYKNKYITRLSVGEGPDIIRIDPKLGLLSAAHKTADSGIFYDLNKLINNDKSFKFPDYNEKVLNSGIINGKRVFLPLGYNFPIFYAKDGALKENGIITEGPKWNLGYLADEAYSFSQKNKDNGKCFMVSMNFNFSDIVKISGLDFIDYEKKEAKFNSLEFIDLLNIYKSLYPTVKERREFNMQVSLSEDSRKFTTASPELDNGTTLIMGSENESLWIKDGLNKRLNVYLFPQYTNKNSILIEPMLSFAINSKSNYKIEAYEFLKLLLSEEYQSNSNVKSDFPYIPVNNNAYLNTADFFISNLGDTVQTANDDSDIEKRRLQIKAQYKEIESISRCDTVDAQVYDIIDSEAKSFIDGKNTAEQTAEIIQDKVMLYLNE